MKSKKNLDTVINIFVSENPEATFHQAILEEDGTVTFSFKVSIYDEDSPLQLFFFRVNSSDIPKGTLIAYYVSAKDYKDQIIMKSSKVANLTARR
jgi:hypothetical protein